MQKRIKKKRKNDKDAFKQIFIDYWSEFKEGNPKYDTEYYEKIIKKMLGCGSYENGYISYQCLKCGEERRVPFSCKSSFCLSCAKVYTDEWVDYIGTALFKGMRYRHVVLTVPEEFRVWFYRNPKLLSALMQEGAKFYKDVVSYWLKEAVEVGVVAVLQTAGRSGSYNPHLHLICSSGGLTKGGEWKGFDYIDFKILHKKWQYHLLGLLKKKARNPEMRKEIDKCWKERKDGLVAYIEKGEVPKGVKGLAQYLAKYVVSPPISLKRIIEYNGKTVRYWYNDHKTGRRQEEEVDAKTFIGKMVQHILPQGFQRIRYYGFQATCRASKLRGKLEGLLSNNTEEEPVGTYRVTGYRERIKKSFGIDPQICTKCGEEMEYRGIWHPKYGWIVDNLENYFGGVEI